MKRLLPILTLALLGAAVTASADTNTKAFDNFYYDYYLGATVTEGEPVSGRQTDTVSYKDFAVERFSQANNNLYYKNDGSTNNANLYRIAITGGSKEDGTKVKLYLTDFVKSLTDSSQALYNNVERYGYRILNEDGSVKLNADGSVKEGYIDMPDNPDGLVAVDGGRSNMFNDPVYRYQYELGTFDNGDVLEIYMKDRVSGNSAYSYNGLAESALGGYGDGGYISPVDENGNRLTDDKGKIIASIVEQTDGLLDLYHFNEAIDGTGATETAEHYNEYKKFDSDKTIAAQKAMPLAGLDIIGYSRGRVYFGIIGETVLAKETVMGQPLPGGLQIVLAAGLFGLGFCYVRRRKVIAG